MIYLASPYSHPDSDMRHRRFLLACRAAARLMHQGHHVFSPIAHTHPIAEAGELPKGWDWWEAFDRAFFEICDSMVVLTLPGWEESRGVQAEIAIARELGLPITLMVWPTGGTRLLQPAENPPCHNTDTDLQ